MSFDSYFRDLNLVDDKNNKCCVPINKINESKISASCVPTKISKLIQTSKTLIPNPSSAKKIGGNKYKYIFSILHLCIFNW